MHLGSSPHFVRLPAEVWRSLQPRGPHSSELQPQGSLEGPYNAPPSPPTAPLLGLFPPPQLVDPAPSADYFRLTLRSPLKCHIPREAILATPGWDRSPVGGHLSLSGAPHPPKSPYLSFLTLNYARVCLIMQLMYIFPIRPCLFCSLLNPAPSTDIAHKLYLK